MNKARADKDHDPEFSGTDLGRQSSSK